MTRRAKPVPGLPAPDHDVRLIEHPADAEGGGRDIEVDVLAVPGQAAHDPRWQDPSWLGRRLTELHAACRDWGYPIPEAATADDALLLVPWIRGLAAFEVDRKAMRENLDPASAGARPVAGSTGRQVALPWEVAVYLDVRSGSRRPVREAQQVGAYVADHLLWQRGVADPGRAARVLCMLTAFDLVDGVLAGGNNHLPGGKADPLVRQRDDLRRIGAQLLDERGALPLLPIHGRLPPDVDRLAVAVAPVRGGGPASPIRLNRPAAPTDLVVVVFGLRADGELVQAAAWVGPMREAGAWEQLAVDLRQRGLRLGGIKEVAGVGVQESALRAVAPVVPVTRIVAPSEDGGETDLTRLVLVAAAVARNAALAIVREGGRRPLTDARRRIVTAVAMMKVSTQAPPAADERIPPG